MRIAMVCGEFPPVTGGVGQYVYHLSEELVHRGNEITVISRSPTKEFAAKNTYGYDVIRIAGPRIPFLDLLIQTPEMRNIIAEIEDHFDIIHFHTPAIPYIRTRCKTIATVHGTVHGALKADLIDWRRIIFPIAKKIYMNNESRIISDSKRIVAVSEGTKKDIERLYDIHREDVDVAYNGVDTNFFRIAHDSQKSKEDPIILFAGALTPRKGIEVFINALSHLKENGISIFNTKIVGKGPLSDWTIQQIERRNLSDVVEYLGFVSREKLRELYQRALIYVLPSIHEGFPTTVLEAMSCSTAVVASNIRGVDELVCHGQNGILFEPFDSIQLAYEINKLCKNPRRAISMGENGRKTVEDRFSWQMIAQEYMKIYESIM